MKLCDGLHPSHNSLPGNLLKQLKDSIDRVGKDDAVQLLVLKSGGERTFCAGASFDELSKINDLDTGKTFFLGFASYYRHFVSHFAQIAKPLYELISEANKEKVNKVNLNISNLTDCCQVNKIPEVNCF